LGGGEGRQNPSRHDRERDNKLVNTTGSGCSGCGERAREGVGCLLSKRGIRNKSFRGGPCGMREPKDPLVPATSDDGHKLLIATKASSRTRRECEDRGRSQVDPTVEQQKKE